MDKVLATGVVGIILLTLLAIITAQAPKIFIVPFIVVFALIVIAVNLVSGYPYLWSRLKDPDSNNPYY